MWVVTSKSTDSVLGTQLLALSALDSAKKEREKEVNSMEKLRDCKKTLQYGTGKLAESANCYYINLRTQLMLNEKRHHTVLTISTEII